MAQVIPFAVYEVVTNHPLLREVEYESFEEVTTSREMKILRKFKLKKSDWIPLAPGISLYDEMKIRAVVNAL